MKSFVLLLCLLLCAQNFFCGVDGGVGETTLGPSNPPSPGPSNLTTPSPGPSNLTTPSPGPSNLTTPSPGPSNLTTPSPGPSNLTTPSPGPSNLTTPSPGPSNLTTPSPVTIVKDQDLISMVNKKMTSMTNKTLKVMLEMLLKQAKNRKLIVNGGDQTGGGHDQTGGGTDQTGGGSTDQTGGGTGQTGGGTDQTGGANQTGPNKQPGDNEQPGLNKKSRKPESSHFAVVFLVLVAMLFGLYALYHNRQKIIAVVVEGRHGNGRGGRERYRKLDNSSADVEARIKNSNEVYVY